MRRFLVVPALCLLSQLVARPAFAQDDEELGRRAWVKARASAVAGRADSALAQYAFALEKAKAAGDARMVAAALRGAAQVHAVHVGCGDSALVLFRQSVAASEPGDRQSADALVRYLATRGDLAAAQALLNETYANIEGLGRAITRESMTWYQGTAAIQRASKKESAALASLTNALSIAARLKAGDVSDTVAKPTGEVDPINYWIVYDMAQLRLHAKAAGVANVATGRKLMDALVNAGIGLDEKDELVVPVARLFDTLVLRAHQCTRNGGTCKAPTLAKCATAR
jgi:hypothetical protein